jgi:hypothetical protein
MRVTRFSVVPVLPFTINENIENNNNNYNYCIKYIFLFLIIIVILLGISTIIYHFI